MKLQTEDGEAGKYNRLEQWSLEIQITNQPGRGLEWDFRGAEASE